MWRSADPDLTGGADAVGSDDSANPFPEESIEFLEDGIDDFAEPMDPGLADGESSEKRSFWPAALVFVLAVAVAWAILSRVSPEPETTVVTQIIESTTTPKKVLVKPVQNADEQHQEKLLQTSQAHQVVKQIQQDRQQAHKQAPVAKPRPIPQQMPVDPELESPRASSAPAPELKAPDTKVAETAATAAPKTLSTAEGSEFSASIARVKTARASDFFVQHIVLSTEAQANLYLGRYSSLRKAMVLPIQAGQSKVYAIISGPFSTRERAEAFAEGAAMPADYWIRGAIQLQGAI